MPAASDVRAVDLLDEARPGCEVACRPKLGLFGERTCALSATADGLLRWLASRSLTLTSAGVSEGLVTRT
jgi:hypothetical protein